VSALEVDALVRSRHLWSFLSSIHAICAVVCEPTSSVSAGEEASGGLGAAHAWPRRVARPLKALATALLDHPCACACPHLRRRYLAESSLHVRASLQGEHEVELDQSRYHRYVVINSVSNGRAGRCVSRWGCHRSKGGDRAIRPDRESHVRGLAVRVHFPTEALIPEAERAGERLRCEHLRFESKDRSVPSEIGWQRLRHRGD